MSEDLESALRRRLEAAGYVVTRYVYPPGTFFPAHTHDVDKIDAVVSGTFEIVLEGRRHLLGPGDQVEVPRGAVHTARVVGDVPVVSLDAVRRV
ncbi:MAG: cupin domain-containing protein [Deltaproteobacteria bacterium]|nr:MAG: cupin domain-containing protein [Deltaproteobacteria bacterium]